MTVFAPRMAVSLYVGELGLPVARTAQALTTDAFRLDIRPIKARWVSNSYREADEIDITCSFDEAGIDPRYLRSAELYFWLDDGGDDFVPSDDNNRFIGIVKDVSREFDETSKIVTLKALDYTTLFLESSPYPQTRLPLWTDTLRTAWQKVCRWTGHWDFSGPVAVILSAVSDLDSSPGAFDGVPRIVLTPIGSVQLDTPLKSSVSARLAELSTMQHQTGTDAWTVWTEVCNTQGLITYIRGDVCYVTQATDYYTYGDPPFFMYGKNVLNLTERRDLGHLSAKHICVRSYDGLTGTSLEAFFPDINDPLSTHIRRKKIKASAKKQHDASVIKEYDLIDLQTSVTDQETLEDIAELIWFERVRQDMTGTLTTRDMSTSTSIIGTGIEAFLGIDNDTQKNFDLLKLQAGDNIQVQVDSDALDMIQAMPTIGSRIAALIQRGYSTDMATYIANNLSSITSLPAQFLVHSCEIEVDVTAESYNMKIEFVNLINIDGSASVQVPDSPQIGGTDALPVPETATTPVNLKPYTPFDTGD